MVFEPNTSRRQQRCDRRATESTRLRIQVDVHTTAFARTARRVSPTVGAMSSTEWGIGVPGALGAKAIGSLAALAEQSGYQSFWFNCVAPDADPAALLDAALASTKTVDVGVG